MSAASLIMKGIQLGVWVTVGINPATSMEVFDKLDELEVRYEIVEETQVGPHADAATVWDGEGNVWLEFTREAMVHPYDMIQMASHELIHLVRMEAGLFGDHYTEEAIAVYGTKRVAELLGFEEVKFNELEALAEVEYANSLKRAKWTQEYINHVENEISKTLSLIEARLAR